MDLWKHRTYIDLWSLVHLASGALLGMASYAFGYGFEAALILTAILLIAWELLEWIVGISETAANIVLDIIIGLAGFFLAAYWYFYLLVPFDTAAFLTVGIPTALVALWGFVDMKVYGYR